ncbi:uncharacterized protein LOC118406333 [Branchiostoma floridae]|uniref:Uncharacterized protein LOC118406333 n=1 Tax=Branchiostoma floridae TaxID=7739 RepID=C3Y7E7_BRAFL|nr:uncharacterized protein LOC118406333 [Branchiostoma floridae]|eukprot:XP_002607765.1 hypothetical protein BRAFLDRAFT_82786 [Branchiostoma floridae]
MGSKLSHGVDMVEEGGERSRGSSPLPTPQTIQFDTVETRLLKNPFPGYEGFLIEKVGQNGRAAGQVVRTEHVTPENKHKVIVLVYTYTCASPVDGTYVVLQFQQSEKYFAAHKNQPGKLILRKRGWNPGNAEDITTTADRRVFLMKPNQLGSRDLVFASRGSFRHVITVFQNIRRVAELEDKGTETAVESQLYQLDFPVLRRAKGRPEGETTGDYLEVVPFPFKPQEGADEQSEQCPDQQE